MVDIKEQKKVKSNLNTMTYPLKIGIIGGSGLDDPQILVRQIRKKIDTPFGPPSDELSEGLINGINCVLLARHGRKHNIPPSKVNYRANIWALKELGCTHVIVSFACGSLKEEIKPGDVVIPDSFIDMTKNRPLTFYNQNEPWLNTVIHIPMEPAFCSETRACILEAARKQNIELHESGTVVVIEGPRFSTLAESKLYRSWNADLVGMTLVPEVILAKEMGLCYAGVAMATDYDCWHETEAKVEVANVLKIFKENVEKITKIICGTIELIVQKEWANTINELQETIQSSVQSKE